MTLTCQTRWAHGPDAQCLQIQDDWKTGECESCHNGIPELKTRVHGGDFALGEGGANHPHLYSSFMLKSLNNCLK